MHIFKLLLLKIFMIRVEMQRVNGEFGFEAIDMAGSKVKLDTSPEDGGHNFGFRPMQLLLASLGECSSIDIISILKKQRQVVENFSLSLEGERHPTEVPSLWTDIVMHFKLSGSIDREKALKACALSIEKYCSVAETLRRAGAIITWDLQIN